MIYGNPTCDFMVSVAHRPVLVNHPPGFARPRIPNGSTRQTSLVSDHVPCHVPVCTLQSARPPIDLEERFRFQIQRSAYTLVAVASSIDRRSGSIFSQGLQQRIAWMITTSGPCRRPPLQQSWTWIGFIHGLDWIGSEVLSVSLFFWKRKRLRLVFSFVKMHFFVFKPTSHRAITLTLLYFNSFVVIFNWRRLELN